MQTTDRKSKLLFVADSSTTVRNPFYLNFGIVRRNISKSWDSKNKKVLLVIKIYLADVSQNIYHLYPQKLLAYSFLDLSDTHKTNLHCNMYS